MMMVYSFSMRICLNCHKQIASYARKYCSNACQSTFQYEKYIKQWKAGNISGNRGTTTYNISSHIVRYIYEKYQNKCAACGWSKINLYSGRPVLEVDHIDGDATNTHETNLILLCPNCHALTSTYRNLNKGRGRSWRKKKYVKMV